MNELLYYYDICSRLINHYETRVKFIDLASGDTSTIWKESEEQLKKLLLIQGEIVRRISEDPNFTKFSDEILANTEEEHNLS